jgi:hypothetical protein
MSFQPKRIVFFFCILYFGLGGCLSNLAMAKDQHKIFISGVYNKADVNVDKRRVWGYVKDQDGLALENVGIYDHDKLLALTRTGSGFFEANILPGFPYTITPKKDGYLFLPQEIEIPAAYYNHEYANFTGHSSIGVVTLISPKGTIYSSLPNYEWVAPTYANSFNLLVEDSTGADKIDKVYTESGAGCASGSANCSVTPSTSLADGSWRWSVQACNSNSKFCGPWSKTMGFIVSAGPQDPILGLWDAGDGGKALMAESTTGGYKFVATITVQGNGWWKERGIKVGDVAWKLNKQPNGHYIGETAVNGNTWYWWPMEVVIQGNQMIDTAGKLVGTKIN